MNRLDKRRNRKADLKWAGTKGLRLFWRAIFLLIVLSIIGLLGFSPSALYHSHEKAPQRHGAVWPGTSSALAITAE